VKAITICHDREWRCVVRIAVARSKWLSREEARPGHSIHEIGEQQMMNFQRSSFERSLAD
jgi:hypothetical protein